MWEEITTRLQNSNFFSIFVSGMVVLMVLLCILAVYSKAREEKRIEELRWKKVSANMALYDRQTRLVIGLEADEILVGRHGSADIRLPSMGVSRYHAVLYVSNGVWSVLDLESKSGTYINGRRISTAARLTEGDVIQFGDYLLVFRRRPARV